MTDYFFDSSALVKRYIPETGSVWVISLHSHQQKNRIFTAEITPIEIMSAVTRRKREGTLSARTARAIRLFLNRHVTREYIAFPLSNNIIQQAMDLQDAHITRAYDAVQVATAVSINRRLTSASLQPLIFLSADNRLLAIAALEGLATENPNNH